MYRIRLAARMIALETKPSEIRGHGFSWECFGLAKNMATEPTEREGVATLCAPCGLCGEFFYLSLAFSELEKQLQRQLADARVAGLLQRAEVPLRAEFREIPGGLTLVKVHAVEDVEKFSAELKFEALGERDI